MSIGCCSCDLPLLALTPAGGADVHRQSGHRHRADAPVDAWTSMLSSPAISRAEARLKKRSDAHLARTLCLSLCCRCRTKGQRRADELRSELMPQSAALVRGRGGRLVSCGRDELRVDAAPSQPRSSAAFTAGERVDCTALHCTAQNHSQRTATSSSTAADTRQSTPTWHCSQLPSCSPVTSLPETEPVTVTRGGAAPAGHSPHLRLPRAASPQLHCRMSGDNTASTPSPSYQRHLPCRDVRVL